MLGPDESETAVLNRKCEECGESYTAVSRNQGGPFHFMVVLFGEWPDGRMRVGGHWRSGDWVAGQALYFWRRDGHRVVITNAEMLPALNEACERRGQRELLVPQEKSLQSRGCIWAIPESPTD
ncbi:hypothetical protein GCM10010439_74230 [Actinocorallia aurantiaca]|uniref:Uncharacterized protein n=1 Tax=Actinocorallia aurantiaca TaxID=46204 RepID=A0ABP6HBC6_9ACTN